LTLTASLVVAVSSRWDLRVGALCVSVPSTGFKVTKGKVKPGWDGEGEITEGQQRGPRMKINKGK